MSNMLTQSIGYGFRASIVAAGRQGIFLIPSLLTLPRFLGILGLQLCQPIADVWHQRHGRGDRRLHTEGVKGLERRNAKFIEKNYGRMRDFVREWYKQDVIFLTRELRQIS